MPDSPAQHTVVLTKPEYGSATERMATPEELLALQLLAEEEEAVIEAIESAALAAQLPEPKDVPALESLKIARVEPAAVEAPLPETAADDQKDQKQDALLKELTELAVEPIAVTESANLVGGRLDLAAILDQHRIWVESGGEAGAKADL